MVELINKNKWKNEIMNLFYFNSFGFIKDITHEKCDFALICYKETKAIGFVTCKEMDGDTIYWQFGGIANDLKKSIHVYKYYGQFIDFFKKNTNYKLITTRIENINIPMLKMAISFGFIISGIWINNNKIYLELYNKIGE